MQTFVKRSKLTLLGLVLATIGSTATCVSEAPRSATGAMGTTSTTGTTSTIGTTSTTGTIGTTDPPPDASEVGDGGDAAMPPTKTWTVEKTPVDVPLWRVWGSGPDDVYALGSEGTILHSTGKGDWVLQPIATHSDLAGISGSGSTNVYLTGVWGCATVSCDADGGQNPGGFFHSTGDGTWQVMLPNLINALDVSSFAPNDAYVMGTGPVDDLLYHLNGAGNWLEEKLPVAGVNPRKMWGSSPNDVYILGHGTTMFHSNGDGIWAQIDLPISNYFDGMWGSGPDDVYLVGQNSTIVHRGADGMWLPQKVPQLNAWPHGVWGSGPDDVWVVTSGFFPSGDILHSDGSGTWTLVRSGDVPCLNDVWGSGPDDVYAVGVNGTILHLE